MNDANFNWDAGKFFAALVKRNRLALSQGYQFCMVPSLEGFHNALGSMLTAPGFVAVCDTSDGYTDIDNSPHTRRVKTIFLAKRHAVDNAAESASREAAMAEMRELFRQFMSVLLLEKTRIEEHNLFVDPQIKFSEISRYFFTGCACAYFQIAVDTYTDLSFNPDEWLSPENQI